MGRSRRQPQITPRGCGFDSIEPSACWPMSEVCRRMGWGRRTREKARADGLRVLRIGRVDYVRGAWLAAYLSTKAEGNGQV